MKVAYVFLLTDLNKAFDYIVQDFLIFKLEAPVIIQEALNVMKN